MIYQTLRPLIFAASKKDPEIAHEQVLDLLEWCDQHPAALNVLESFLTVRDAKLQQQHMGLIFPHPIGLAAGFSKDGLGAKSLAKIFGFLELGTVTPLPQTGNPRPRIFRLVKDQGLINRMGFNNHGAKALAEKRQAQGQLEVPVGISIGKAKDTPLENAGEDYQTCLETVYDYGDYFAVNVSSPNTKDLRQLQGKNLLRHTLLAVITTVKRLALERHKSPKPVVVKIAPDLTITEIEDILDVCCALNISGVVATNTTISRGGLRPDSKTQETGGYSGPQLFSRSLDIVKHIRKQNTGLTIIAVGGISRDCHAKEMLENGADLLQLLTGLIYEGPFVVKNILSGLLQDMEISKEDLHDLHTRTRQR
jgi:dihydroorotate dehydrogenase